jgi:hypothetical protein
MKIKPGLPQSLAYIVTGALLLYQFLWELTHCCVGGEKLQELIKFFTEGWFFLLLLLSGSLLLTIGFLRLIGREDVGLAALIATLIGLVFYLYGIGVFFVYLLFIFTNVKALIFVLTGSMLIVSFIISAREVIQSLRSKG